MLLWGENANKAVLGKSKECNNRPSWVVTIFTLEEKKRSCLNMSLLELLTEQTINTMLYAQKSLVNWSTRPTQHIEIHNEWCTPVVFYKTYLVSQHSSEFMTMHQLKAWITPQQSLSAKLWSSIKFNNNINTCSMDMIQHRSLTYDFKGLVTGEWRWELTFPHCTKRTMNHLCWKWSLCNFSCHLCKIKRKGKRLPGQLKQS